MTVPLPALADVVARADAADRVLGETLMYLATAHEQEAEVYYTARRLAGWCEARRQALQPWNTTRLTEERLVGVRAALFGGGARGLVGLLRDLEGTWLIAQMATLAWTALAQAAKASAHSTLETVSVASLAEVGRQSAWVLTAIKHATPQALLVPPPPDAVNPVPAAPTRRPVPRRPETAQPHSRPPRRGARREVE